MKRIKFYKKVITSLLDTDSKIPIVFYAVSKSGETHLLRSNLAKKKGYEQEEIIELCATMRIAFTLYDVERYSVIFPTTYKKDDLIIIAEVEGKGASATALSATKTNFPKYTGFDIEETKSGIFLNLLETGYGEAIKNSILAESPDLLKDIKPVWEAMKFNIDVVEPDFAELSAAFS